VPEIFPRIAWQSVIDAATLTATPSTTGTDGAVTNCQDWKPWSFWRPTGSAPWVLEADLGGTFAVNCAAFYGHDLDDTVGVDYWTGAAWVEVATTEADGGGDAIYLTWSSVSTTKLRFRFDQLTYLAILYAGTDLQLPEGLAPGWSDPTMAQRAQTTQQVSRGGVWLGNTVEYWAAQLTLSLKSVEPDWLRDYWIPFLRECTTRPFFLHWNSTDWPDSACLCSNCEFGDTPFGQFKFTDVQVTFQAETGRRTYP
jgi:hypothetical protein